MTEVGTEGTMGPGGAALQFPVTSSGWSGLPLGLGLLNKIKHTLELNLILKSQFKCGK